MIIGQVLTFRGTSLQKYGRIQNFELITFLWTVFVQNNETPLMFFSSCSSYVYMVKLQMNMVKLHINMVKLEMLVMNMVLIVFNRDNNSRNVTK